jgi:hypothetical protein
LQKLSASNKNTTMNKSKRSFSLLLAIVAGASAFSVLAPLRAAADPTDLITICFRNRSIQIPQYLLPRYQSVPGTTVGNCITTP